MKTLMHGNGRSILTMVVLGFRFTKNSALSFPEQVILWKLLGNATKKLGRAA